MANVVVVGAQWGDEGKGKIVDWLSEQADIVVRFQGGHNAGHTLVINGETYKLALLPSGVLRPSKLAVIGNGVVFDPQAFLDEVTRLKGQGVAVSPDNLRVAENVTLILPLHRELDSLRESSNSGTAIGTTRRGSGFGPGAVGYVLGICKAYTTRVGEGPFPTEQDNEIGRKIGERGREFGTNTGRPRRCGWFDAVLVRQTVRTSGITGLALTKLDILDGFDSIEVCTGYMLDGKEIDHLPAGEGAQARVVPVYETIEGWKEPTANARSWADLPAQAIKYVRRVEELVGCPIALLSTSPEREDTILVQNPFEA